MFVLRGDAREEEEEEGSGYKGKVRWSSEQLALEEAVRALGANNRWGAILRK